MDDNNHAGHSSRGRPDAEDSNHPTAPLPGPSRTNGPTSASVRGKGVGKSSKGKGKGKSSAGAAHALALREAAAQAAAPPAEQQPQTSSQPGPSGQQHPKVNGGSDSSNLGTNMVVPDLDEMLLMADEVEDVRVAVAGAGGPNRVDADAAVAAAEANSDGQRRQEHSSILESMTGPLSKRLRTLHTLQQQQQSEVWFLRNAALHTGIFLPAARLVMN